MNDETKSGARWDLGNIPIVILCGSVAAIYASEGDWLDGAAWACMAVAMLLTHGMDLRQPGVWKRPHRLVGIALAVAALAFILVRLAMNVLR
ncbi:MAG: hypothetical protein RMN52_01615 [Anaerolineae bacterium]|nr:hypothetical protein [Candidatus Roseilinea sp.]MDW8448676.1 hypothetical protein [Anaerolineae bacterium]